MTLAYKGNLSYILYYSRFSNKGRGVGNAGGREPLAFHNTAHLIYKNKFNDCKDHRNKKEVPDPIVKDLISDKIRKTYRSLRAFSFKWS